MMKEGCAGMNTAGTSGTHDTDMHDMSNTNTMNTDAERPETNAARQMGKAETTETPASGTGKMGNATGERAGTARATYENPEDYEGYEGDESGVDDEELEAVMVEVLTQDSGEGLASDEMRPAGFRWWYVPAIALPVAAGAATATVLILRQRRKSQIQAAIAQTRDWLDTLRLRQAMNQAGDWWQQGTQWAQQTAQTLPKQLTRFQGQTQKQLRQTQKQMKKQAPPPSTLRDRALDQFTTLRKQMPDMISTWRDRALTTAQPVMDAARMRALATRDSASQTLSDAGDRVNSTISHTLAFGLGALVAATGTYIGLWRQRMAQEEREQTTGANSRQMHEEPIL